MHRCYRRKERQMSKADDALEDVQATLLSSQRTNQALISDLENKIARLEGAIELLSPEIAKFGDIKTDLDLHKAKKQEGFKGSQRTEYNDKLTALGEALDQEITHHDMELRRVQQMVASLRAELSVAMTVSQTLSASLARFAGM